MNQSKVYKVYYNEVEERWEAISEDQQDFGWARLDYLNQDGKEMAPALALCDLLGFDMGLIQEELELELKEEKADEA